MFYSGWRFATPTGFDLTSLPGSASIVAAPPAALPSPSAPSTAAAPARAGDAVRGARSASQTVLLPSAAHAGSPAAARAAGPLLTQRTELVTVAGADGCPSLQGKGVAHLYFQAPRRGGDDVPMGGESAKDRGVGGAARARRAASAGAGAYISPFHVRSNHPLLRSLGTAYMEVQVESLPEDGGGGGVEGEGGAVAPGLVLGVCTDALPPHRQPGECEASVGLFVAQSTVYSNGVGDGERIDLHSSSHAPPLAAYFACRTAAAPSPPESGGACPPPARRGVRVGDAFGVLADLTEGTVQFTVNGHLVKGYVGRLRAATASAPRADAAAPVYYFALGAQRQLAASLSLRVVFQVGVVPVAGLRVVRAVLPGDARATASESAGGSPDARPLHSPTAPDAAEGVVAQDGEDADDCCAIAFDLAAHIARYTARRMVVSDARLRDPSWREGALSDAALVPLIRQYFVARGLTESLECLEREAGELCSGCESAAAPPTNSARTRAVGAQPDGIVAYTAAFAEARRGVLGDGAAAGHALAPSVLFSRHVFLPTLRAALDAAFGRLPPDTASVAAAGPSAAADELPPSYWGLLLYSRRMDVLFALKALQAAELTLATCDEYLDYQASLLLPRRASPCAHEAQAKPHGDANGYTGAESLAKRFVNASHVAARLLATYTDSVMRPMEQLRTQARHHGGASSWGDLAALSRAQLQACFYECLQRDPARGTARASKELAATALVTASVPQLAPPDAAAQLRLGDMLVSVFVHTHAFFSQLTHDDAASSRAGGRSSAQLPTGAAPSTGHADACRRQQFFRACLENWRSLLRKACEQYRQRALALLQRTVEESNGEVGSVLRSWLTERAAAAHREERVHEEKEKRASQAVDSSRREGAAAARDGGSEAESLPSSADADSVLTQFTHPQSFPLYVRHLCGGDSTTRRDLSDAQQALVQLLARLPPGQPSLRAMYRRCLAVASLEPLSQASTSFFLHRLESAMALTRQRLDGLPHFPEAKAPATPLAGSTVAAAAETPGSALGSDGDTGEARWEAWAADELYLMSVYLHRIYSDMFP